MFAALADFLLVIHATFVLFVVGGGTLALRWPRVAWFHIPAAVWGAAIELTGWICPLTPWEARLRFGGDPDTPARDFIERILTPLIYPEWLTRERQIAMGFGVILLNAIVYGVVIARWRLARARSSEGHRSS